VPEKRRSELRKKGRGRIIKNAKLEARDFLAVVDLPAKTGPFQKRGNRVKETKHQPVSADLLKKGGVQGSGKKQEDDGGGEKKQRPPLQEVSAIKKEGIKGKRFKEDKLW